MAGSLVITLITLGYSTLMTAANGQIENPLRDDIHRVNDIHRVDDIHRVRRV